MRLISPLPLNIPLILLSPSDGAHNSDNQSQKCARNRKEWQVSACRAKIRRPLHQIHRSGFRNFNELKPGHSSHPAEEAAEEETA